MVSYKYINDIMFSKKHKKSRAAVVRSGPRDADILAPKNTTSQGPQGPEGHAIH